MLSPYSLLQNLLNVDKKQKLPTIEGYTWADYGYILAKGVLYPGQDVIAGKVNKAPKPYIGKNGPIKTPLFIKCFGGTTNHIHSTSYSQPISA